MSWSKTTGTKRRAGLQAVASVTTAGLRRRPVADLILALLTEPRSLTAIAAHLGCPANRAIGHLATMRDQGLVIRLGHAAYARADYGGPPVEFRSKRPQPIRDAILAFLTGPRSAGEIAVHIDRPVPTATGHLAAMGRRGLVKRLGYAAYASAEYSGPPVEFRPSKGAALDHASIGQPIPTDTRSGPPASGRATNHAFDPP